jgi:hypothetical protein
VTMGGARYSGVHCPPRGAQPFCGRAHERHDVLRGVSGRPEQVERAFGPLVCRGRPRVLKLGPMTRNVLVENRVISPG